MSTIENLVITGSNGFVGRSLLDYIACLSLEEQPRSIITLNRTDQRKEIKSRYPKLNIEYRITDLARPWSFRVPNSHLINLAADGSANSYNESATELFNTIGAHCAEWIRDNKPIKVFHASSGVCNGIIKLANSELDITNVGTLVPKETFIKSRLTVENALSRLAEKENSEIIIGRLFSFVGFNILSKMQYALPSFILGAVNNRKISVNGNPNTIRSYLHESDMSDWIFRSLQAENPLAIISIGSSIKVRISELAEFIAMETGADVEYLNPNAPGDIYFADNTSTLESLGVSETKNWQDAVVECIEKVKGLKN